MRMGVEAFYGLVPGSAVSISSGVKGITGIIEHDKYHGGSIWALGEP